MNVHIYAKILPEKPYGSMDAMFQAELGISPEAATEEIRLRARGRPKKDEEKTCRWQVN